MRLLDIYQDFNIDHITEGNRHAREGWVNVHCPFCQGSQDYHLGYNTEENYFNCWRCGSHFKDKTIATLLNISLGQAQKIIKDYGGGGSYIVPERVKPKINLKKFKFPSKDLELRKPHRRYLEDRGFDPDLLQRTWDLRGTGPIAMLDGVDYSRRILAPIYWGGEIGTFQARALFDTMEPKYMACPMEREIFHHQHILYGHRDLQPQKKIVCVEGIVDVWRLGVNSVAVFGIDFTAQQVRELARMFEEVIILFDPEPAAQRQARKLRKQLMFYGTKVTIERKDTDPGDMSQKDADKFMNHLFTKNQRYE